MDAWAAAGEIALGNVAALEELESDKFAPTTKGPKNSRREFVEGLVVRATGHLYPLAVAGPRRQRPASSEAAISRRAGTWGG